MNKYQDSKNKYLKEKVDEFKIRVPKGQKQIIQDFAKLNGMSLNSFVVSLINSAVPELNKNSDKWYNVHLSVCTNAVVTLCGKCCRWKRAFNETL